MVAFVAIAALAVLTPGADTLLVVRAVIERGTRAGLWTTAGICAGCTVHATMSAAGISVLLIHSPRAYEALRLAGAAYLLYLGIASLRAAVRTPELEHGLDQSPRATEIAAPRLGFRDGLFVNVLNPKVSLFYLALVPQFVERSAGVIWSYALLTGIHIVLAAVWFTLLSFVLGRVRDWLLSPTTRRVLDAIAGIVMIGLAVYTGSATR